MTTKCLIIAAGKGSRLRQAGDSKPLIPVLGMPLIERVIRSALKAGTKDIYVIIGYQGNLIRTFLDALASRLGIQITCIVNNEWEKENGLSVLKAGKYLNGPFLLLMADHLFDPSIAEKLMEFPLGDEEIVLGVDGNIENPLIDIEDATRVKTKDGNIQDIGKGLTEFNAFDTGIFMCSPAIFSALKQSGKEHGDTSLSGGVRVLAAKGQAKTVEIDGRFWIDVDDPAAFSRAEKALMCNTHV